MNIKRIDIYENGIFRHAFKYDKENVRLNDIIHDKSILNKIHNIPMTQDIDFQAFNNGYAIVSVKTIEPYYVLSASKNKIYLLNNALQMLDIDVDSLSKKYINSLIKIKIPSMNYYNNQVIIHYIKNKIKVIQRACKFDKIRSIIFLENLMRINIKFYNTPDVAMIANKMQYRCALLNKFIQYMGDKINHVSFIDMRMPKNLIFSLKA